MSAKRTCHWCHEPVWECVCDLPDSIDTFDGYDATDLTGGAA